MDETISKTPGVKVFYNYNQLVDWARNYKLNKLIFPYETTGNEILNKRELIEKLKGAQIAPFFLMRDWDRHAFPFANKGFFPFKKKIPYLLKVNNLT